MNIHDIWSKIGFLPSLLYIFLADRTGIEDYYTRIDKNVILGALPTHSVLEKVSMKISGKQTTFFVSIFSETTLYY